LAVGRSKTEAGEGRTIPLNSALHEALTSYSEWYVLRFGKVRPEWYVFPFGKPRPHDPTRPVTTLKTAWQNLRKKANVTGRARAVIDLGLLTRNDARTLKSYYCRQTIPSQKRRDGRGGFGGAGPHPSRITALFALEIISVAFRIRSAGAAPGDGNCSNGGTAASV